MLPAATAVRILAPASVAVLVFIYKYLKSGAKTEVPDHMSPHSPGGGGGAPPHTQDERAPLDLDPAVGDSILNVVNAHLDANRSFNNPAVLDESPKLLRNFDPADDIVAKVERLCLEENKPGEQEPARSNGPSSSTETESPTIVQGSSLDHAPSDLDPATLDEIRRLDPAVLGEMLKLVPLILDRIRNHKAVSLPPGECWTYLKTGTCKNRSSCKFKHPPRSKDKQMSDDWGESWNGYENGSDIWGLYDQSSGGGGQNESDNSGGGDVEKAAESWSRTYQYYPARPEAVDCSFYLKNGTCKFGSNCKFNHPVRRNSNQVPKERMTEWEESAENPGQTECKYYLRPGGCKYGNACRYLHSRVAPVTHTNFAGLPVRLGEKECAYYMQHGECKYGSSCKFSHPDPVAEGGSDPFSGGGPALQVAPEATWSAPRSLNETPSYVPMMIPPPPGVLSQTTEWTGYQGEKKCPHYMRNGSCKYGLNCKYNHPDPKAVGETHPVSRYGKGGPATFQGASSSTVELSSARRSLNKAPPYMPPKVIPPSQWDPYTELNSYQAPANLPERSMPVHQPYGIDNSVTETTTYQQHLLKKQVEESPERPGRPVCNFSKTGYCRKSNCNYHHPPKYQTSVSPSPSCELSDKGLPLRPGQNICTQYSSYGICSSGPSCKFDHPSLSTFTL